MKNLKSKKYLFIILILLAILLFVGISYAFLSFSVFGTKTYTITGGDISLTIDDSNNDLTVGTDNALPVPDNQGLEQTGYNFTVKNTSSMTLNYYIYIDDNEDNTINTDVIRYNYINNIENVNYKGNMKDLTNRLLVSGTLDSNEEIDYNLKFWISLDATNEDILGKVFSVKIRVVGEQVLDSNNNG